MNKPPHSAPVPAMILILVWSYTGMEKIIRFESSRKAFHNQTFPAELAEVLSYAVPAAELLLVFLLLFNLSRWWGLLGSLLLLTVFLSYVGLIWVGAFPRVPCNCAGIIESLGWAEHFVLNSILIGITIYGLWINRLNTVDRTNFLAPGSHPGIRDAQSIPPRPSNSPESIQNVPRSPQV